MSNTVQCHPYPALVLVLLATMSLPWSVGCQRPTPVESMPSAQVADDEIELFWDATLSILRKHGFRPDKQDRAMGVIETLPITSRQWGEFWRQDVADTYSLAHASLHTTQRKATVHFIRSEGAEGGWRVEVQVDVYRLSMPESQITTASSAIQAFGGVLPTTEGVVNKDARSRRHWVRLGRDAVLESRLLDRILACAY